ncbi:MAG: hypothetical protein M3N13_04750 [Candidatus Eremiobacteraeota bacterium]|nr:hypothetical protein [Candidatus Eremiobacteraeota bacterium]
MKRTDVSLANEFALRLLQIAGTMKLDELRTFLGFSPSETVHVLKELLGRDWIRVEPTSLEISIVGESLFGISGDGVPRIVETAPYERTISFEAISMAPLHSRAAVKSPRSGIRLTCEAGAASDFVGKAARNFQDAYHLGFEDSGDNVSKTVPTVYGVNGVEFRGADDLEIRVPIELVLENSEAYDVRFNYDDIDGFATVLNTQPVVAASSNAISNLSVVTSDSETFEFVSRFDSGFLSAYFNASASTFDASKWFLQRSDSDSSLTVPLFGSLALEESRERLLEAVEIAYRNALRTAAPSIITLLPAVEYSARDAAWIDLTKDLFARLADTQSSFLLSTAHGMDSDSFRNSFAPRGRQVGYNVGLRVGNNIPGGLELILLGECVCALVYVTVGESEALLPIGFVSTDSAIVAAVRRELRTAIKSGAIDFVWQPQNSSIEEITSRLKGALIGPGKS